MATSLDKLLASLDRLYQAPRGSEHLFRRDQLDLLIAATDDDAAAAIARHPGHLGSMLTESPSFWLSYLGGRPVGWVVGAIARLPEPLVTEDARSLLGPLDRFASSPTTAPAYGRLMSEPSLRSSTADRLAKLRTPLAWSLLRHHDGPDLPLAVRLAALLVEQPGQPQPGLAAFLGREATPEVRAAALAWLGAWHDHARLHDDVVPLLEGCLDDGLAPAVTLQLLVDLRSARRRLFDRLWPLAQAGKSPLPWP
ncbi:MAG: hypothetical protein EOO75_03660, partial [Myxococcales bacterium]